jgi:hypothetical protein
MLSVTREQHARSKSAVENWIKTSSKNKIFPKDSEKIPNLSLILVDDEEI